MRVTSVIRPFMGRSLENFTIVGLFVGILLNIVLIFVPSVAFGTFWEQVGIISTCQLVVYLAMKVGVLKRPAVVQNQSG